MTRVVYVGAAGAAVLAQEAGRLDAMRRAAIVPDECGPEIIAAPARGGCAVFTPHRMVLDTAKGEWEAKAEGYLGRKAVRVADVFDRMAADAAKRQKPMPLTKGHVLVGRYYRDLVERHEAGGVRCVSLETLQGAGAGGSGNSFIDDYVAEGRAIERMRQRIGAGVAMAVRRVRPSTRGVAARTITDRALVDAVCLSDMTLSQVLAQFGWSKRGDNIRSLSKALCDALERMR
ncbi:hypothetical protein RPE78_09555 [Thioclava litoralis]|uniref:Uncharacterized protein n=1 Tax=Thioclava litoralis TaxID=3076557 RepID=A0ABZ1DW00_9RHOB|nr:hypothetical protein RPE78_09555 [Thioclava sp. FTW29]